MFEAISKLFKTQKDEIKTPNTNIAVAALLVHLAGVDGVVSKTEQDTIKKILKGYFNLDEKQVSQLIEEATKVDKEAVDFYQFTSSLSKLEENERIEIIRLLWQVAFADDYNHELEDNMIWRIAELIGVSNRERTILRREMRPATEIKD